MADLQLTTRVLPGQPQVPPQSGATTSYFGEQSNDLQINKANDFATLSGLVKLQQDINKILLTEQGTNTNFPLYGTTLQSMIGSPMDFQAMQAQISDQVIGALQVLQFLNQNNPNQDEIPAILQSLVITQPAPDTIQVQLSVITASNKQFTTGVSITVAP